MRFWTLVAGLGLVVVAARNLAPGGLDRTEYVLLTLMLALVALALLIEGVCSAIEARYTDEPEDSPTDIADLAVADTDLPASNAVRAAHPHPDQASLSAQDRARGRKGADGV